MRILLLLRGSASCGKSTWIEQHGLKPYALSADDIRLLCQSPVMLPDGTEGISQDNDSVVWKTLFAILEVRMQRGDFTVIDATNSKTSEMNRYKEMCETYRYRMYCVDFTDIPIEEVKRRNAARETFKRVPEAVIDNMYSRFRTQKIPSGIKVIRPEELDAVWTRLFDMSSYKRIHHIGDIHGCNTALQTVILGHMSSSAIAAHSISSTIFLFLKVTSVGASSAAAVLTGKTVGTGNLAKIREYTRTFQVLFLGIGILLGAALFFIRIPLLGLYSLEPQTRELANAFILIESTVLVVMSYQMCMNTGVICGGGDTRYVMVMDLIVIWGIVIPLSFASAFLWNASPVVVLLVLNADQYLKCIPAAVYGNSFRWIRLLTRPGGEEESSAG